MLKYAKINTVFKRDPDTNYKALLIGDYSEPEFEFLKDSVWEWTEKIDGMNVRVMFNGGELTFGGKTDKAQIPGKLLSALENMFSLQQFQDEFGTDPIMLCFYGEGYGGYIQSGRVYRPDESFILFDVLINGWWLKREDVNGIAEKFGIDAVPIVGEGTLDELVEFVKSTPKSIIAQDENYSMEGIVARPKVDLYARNGSRIMTKLKHKDFSE